MLSGNELHVYVGTSMVLFHYLSGNGGSLHTENWLPSLGWRPAPHHLNSTKLWATIQQEAKDDAVSECTIMALQTMALQKLCFLLARSQLIFH